MIISIVATALFLNTPSLSQERLPIEVIPKLSVESIDYASLFAEDVNREMMGLPYRFAQPTETKITPRTHGLWEKLPNNQMRWTYRVTCENAVSMNVGFSKYNMPASGSMVILNQDIHCQIRPFTAEDNKDHGELWTPIIPSNSVTIEIIVVGIVVAHLLLLLLHRIHSVPHQIPRTSWK